jgi:hypothetical protein
LEAIPQGRISTERESLLDRPIARTPRSCRGHLAFTQSEIITCANLSRPNRIGATVRQPANWWRIQVH